MDFPKPLNWCTDQHISHTWGPGPLILPQVPAPVTRQCYNCGLVQKQITYDPWVDLTPEEIEADIAAKAAREAELAKALAAVEATAKNAAKPATIIDQPPQPN